MAQAVFAGLPVFIVYLFFQKVTSSASPAPRPLSIRKSRKPGVSAERNVPRTSAHTGGNA